ncbi:hypothetical protein [Rhizobium favelukesii]|uniref:Transmembrane protein n=1 Tax=Rhizobium favelukesii TaxID=348824 RepID=W6R8H5_9HYPH|nr:hypothetical protein [Rhizobium favelukesii]MCS0459958.1 hypothetical protein [Rhizobium favelukesii]CDM57214.1 hypothetical protein LPU83_1542 [Rhizobium favelukesii]
MTTDVPLPQPFAPTEAPPSTEGEINSLDVRLAQLELKIDEARLSGEAKHRDLLISEVRQRIRVRYWVVIIAMVAMFFMGVVLSHAAHHYFWGPVVIIPPAVAIAMFVGPIISITTITIVLLVGAFRRFKDDDMDQINVASIAAEATKSVVGR